MRIGGLKGLSCVEKHDHFQFPLAFVSEVKNWFRVEKQFNFGAWAAALSSKQPL